MNQNTAFEFLSFLGQRRKRQAFRIVNQRRPHHARPLDFFFRRNPRPIRHRNFRDTSRCGLFRRAIFRIAINPDCFPAALGGHTQFLCRTFHQCVPGLIIHACTVLETADVKPLLRPRQRHIEQAPMLVQRLRIRRLLGSLHGKRCNRIRHREQDAVIGIEQLPLLRVGSRSRRIRQDHYVGLKPLRPMYCHHANLIAPAFHVALDLGPTAFDPMQEAFQRRRVLHLVRKGKRKKFLDCVTRLRAQPRKQLQPHPANGQNLRVEFIRRHEIRPRQAFRKKVPRIIERCIRAALQSPPKRTCRP